MTIPLLDVVEVFLVALQEGNEELHGWAIMKSAKRTGPTIYGILDRLESAGWVTGRWEQQPPDTNKPRRRFYRLTPTGVLAARNLLAECRPDALRSPSRAWNKPGLALFGRNRDSLVGGA